MRIRSCSSETDRGRRLLAALATILLTIAAGMPWTLGAPVTRISLCEGDTGTCQGADLRLQSGATGSLLQVLSGQPEDRLGGAFASAGDLEGDGVADFIAGAPEANPNGRAGGGAGEGEGAAGGLR